VGDKWISGLAVRGLVAIDNGPRGGVILVLDVGSDQGLSYGGNGAIDIRTGGILQFRLFQHPQGLTGGPVLESLEGVLHKEVFSQRFDPCVRGIIAS
jgi:hypothetical protein